MAREIFTFSLEGDQISPETLANKISSFTGLLRALNDETAPEIAVDWVIAGLSMSSPTVSVRAVTDEREVLDEISDTYVETWSSVQAGRPIPLSTPIRRHVDAMTDLVAGEITAVHIHVDEESWVFRKPSELALPPEPPITTFGSIEGYVRNLQDPQGTTLSFVLVGTGYPGHVTCHVTEDDADELRRIWRGRVRVDGHIEWDARQEKPRHIRNITSIYDVQLGEGITPFTIRGLSVPDNTENPESILRRLRDEW